MIFDSPYKSWPFKLTLLFLSFLPSRSSITYFSKVCGINIVICPTGLKYLKFIPSNYSFSISAHLVTQIISRWWSVLLFVTKFSCQHVLCVGLYQVQVQLSMKICQRHFVPPLSANLDKLKQFISTAVATNIDVIC